MPSCKFCKKNLPELAPICPYCGKWQIAPDANTSTDSDDDIDQRLESIEKKIESRIGSGKNRKSAIQTTQSEVERHETGIPKEQAKTSTKSGGEITPDILMPDPSEVDNYRKIVFESSHVKSNSIYAVHASKTLFNYYPDDQKLNAYAAHTNLGPRIVLLGGLVRVFSEMALMITYQAFSGMEQVSSIRGIHSIVPLESQEQMEIPANMYDSFVMTGRELLASMVIYVIAHEMGHVVYGHIYGPGYEMQPIDVSRNQERDADSFASSVIASSYYAPFLVQGQILALYAFAMIEKDTGESSEPGTHPIAKERLKNAIRANSEAAEAMGLSEELIDEMFEDLH